MKDAAQEAIRFVEGRRRGDLDKDRKLTLALVKEIETIGEAAYQVSQDTRSEFQKIPWDHIVNMRHRLVDAYFDINLDVLWKTVEDDLPPLLRTLDDILSSE